MPKRTDIKKVLVIGSGPIIIGQACEFDYSGTQACKALHEEGYKVVLVNSNPATIMTDPGMADITYIEPLTVEHLEKVIEKERPDALLPNLGGQTGLNLSSELSKKGILDKYNVKLIGVNADTIARGEDRILFKETMAKLNIPVPESRPSYSVEEAEQIAESLGYPVVLRPAYTLGGTGGGIVYNIEELRVVVQRGLAASMINQVLVEQCVLGWEELELEVVRDSKGRKITVCFIENIDPMGVHTGDSFCVAPMLTISQELQDRLQEMSYRIVDEIGVIGGTNIQFAHDPKTGQVVVIEINPRTSRSSALASKATGFPIARVSAKLAAGINLEELPYYRSGTLDKYTPGGDYVVAKFARWAFEKFPEAEDKIGTQMQAVGEVMSIGKDFKETFQKSIRSLEIKRYGLGNVKKFMNSTLSELRLKLVNPSSERYFLMYEALKKGMSVDELYEMTKVKKYFIEQMKELVELEEVLAARKGKGISDDLLKQAKKGGFSDIYLSLLLEKPEEEIRKQRLKAGLSESYDVVPVSGANGAYYYSTYKGKDKVEVSGKRKIMILGGGPNRIGQGIEFDYTCVHAAFAMKEENVESIMVNCNPETVSTDYDTSDKLYFEPLTVEDVLSIYEKEKPEGVIVQFGGQTPLNIAQELSDAGVKILGTSTESISLAEDREKFRVIMNELGIPQPEGATGRSVEEALKIAGKIGYPVMVRPSFVLGGRGMKVVYNEQMLLDYAKLAVDVSPEYPMLIDKFLEQATEAEVDAICDGEDVVIPAIMEHIELAGVHSGDSACVIPSRTLSKQTLKTMEEYTEKIAREFRVKGLINIQYAVMNNKVYILEANPRASRTVPLVSKVMGISMAKIATKVMLGKKLKDILKKYDKDIKHVGVKEAVFPFNMFPAVDPVLGPEMKATGEVLGISSTFGVAYYKAQEAVGMKLPVEGSVFLSVADKDKKSIVEIAKKLKDLGFLLVATKGTKEFLEKNDIDAQLILKIHEGRPSVVDEIFNKKVNMLINTPVGEGGKYDDSYIRKAAIQQKIPYITSIAAAFAAVNGIEAIKNDREEIKSIQEYNKK
ncbi:MAG: carbamoyl-phosphate synthase large subunit [Endomicrobiales bacterium]|nr:carbamoyl-phosphate synthase large subunit [Endomicrobiales bacterium]